MIIPDIYDKALDLVNDFQETDERVKAMLGLVNFISLVADHITSGGTLTGLCQAYKVPYYAIIKHIDNDETMRGIYHRALAYRREHFAERVLEELRELISFNLGDLWDDDGKLLKFHLIPIPLQKAIKSIDFEKNKITFVDRLKAIETLAKTTNLLNIKVEVENAQTLEDLIGSSFIDPPPPKVGPLGSMNNTTLSQIKSPETETVDVSHTVDDISQGVTGLDVDAIPENSLKICGGCGEPTTRALCHRCTNPEKNPEKISENPDKPSEGYKTKDARLDNQQQTADLEKVGGETQASGETQSLVSDIIGTDEFDEDEDIF